MGIQIIYIMHAIINYNYFYLGFTFSFFYKSWGTFTYNGSTMVIGYIITKMGITKCLQNINV